MDNEAEKYFETSPYTYALNNPIVFIDPDGNKVIGFMINIEKAEAVVVSDVTGLRTVPVAVGSSETPSPSSGTILKIRSTAWGPVSSLWTNTHTSWQQDNNNPFGPAILILEHNENQKSDRHLHGTSGLLEGGITYLGGENAEDRKFTHGCVRFTNEEIVKIMNEGVEKGSPVYFANDELANAVLQLLNQLYQQQLEDEEGDNE